MNKNIVIALLACSTGVFAFLAFRGSSGRASISSEQSHSSAASGSSEKPVPLRVEASTPPQHAMLPVVDPAELAALKTENDRLQKTVRDLQSEVSILNTRRTPAPAANVDAANLPQPSQRALAELLGNKDTVGMAMDLIKADQTRRFASLIALAGLDGPKTEQLRNLLAERYATRLDVAAAGLQSVTPEQRQQLDTDSRSRIEQLVGPEIAALFEKAEGKPVSFERIQRLDERLRYEAQPLTQEQVLPLWNLMSSQVFYAQPVQSEADIQALMQRRVDGAAAVLDGAKTMLNASQLSVLTALVQDDLAAARVQTYRSILAFRARQQGGPQVRPPVVP